MLAGCLHEKHGCAGLDGVGGALGGPSPLAFPLPRFITLRCCRESVRARMAPGDFLECYMRIPIEVGRVAVCGGQPVGTIPS